MNSRSERRAPQHDLQICARDIGDPISGVLEDGGGIKLRHCVLPGAVSLAGFAHLNVSPIETVLSGGQSSTLGWLFAKPSRFGTWG